MSTPCWGFHVSAIPANSERIVDGQGGRWLRAGPRSWQRADDLDRPERFYEGWILENLAPVRCASTEDLLSAREVKLAELLLDAEAPPSTYLLPDQPRTSDDWPDSLLFEPAMALMRAGWMAWGPKQRREALAALRNRDPRELAATS